MSTVKVKVKVSVLISHLENALAEREQRYKNQDKVKSDYKRDLEKYNLAVLKVLKSTKPEILETQEIYYHEETRDDKKRVFCVTVSVPKSAFPDEPERPDIYERYEYEQETKEIKQALRVLKLTDEQYVSASTYASVARYL
jgi:hypothetical protein